MAAATQPQHPPPPSSSSADEEALKRNTDCVYFLASPLTCKKPLDGLIGTQVPAFTPPSLPPSNAAAAPATHSSQGSGKQAVPCIFFQKGLCLKGDRCAFSHGPKPTGNKVLQPLAPNTGSELQPVKKAFGLQKCTEEIKVPGEKLSKAVQPLEVKPIKKVDTSPSNGVGIESNAFPPKSTDSEAPRYKGVIPPLAVNGNSSRSSRLHQSQVDDPVSQNGKDGDELLRDSSPGFDVLVDGELGDSDYYHGDDQYGRTGGHEGRNLNSVDEYDLGHSTDYSSMGEIDRETRDPRGYDSYERMQGQHARDHHRASSERILVDQGRFGKRGKTGSMEPNDEIDLRYRLSKQRRVNGLRSVVSHDYVPDSHGERGHRGASRRESHHTPSQESSLSSRLRGRIKLPGRFSDNGNDLHGETEMEWDRNSGRLSPGRSQMPSQQGRFRDRIKGRGEEEYSDGRNFRGRMRREVMDGSSDFAGPKSLSELKVVKNVDRGEQQSLRKRKYLEDHQPSESNVSFEGPLSLAEILKRKREAEAAGSGCIIASDNKVDLNNNKASKDSVAGSQNNAVVVDKPSDLSSALKEGSI
ncbi:hypothetical protein Tsubulata_038698, partial [Turnera subulata]